jgi:putative thioredoxin
MDDTNAVFDVTPESFQTEVIERSQQMPVLLLFWAEQVAPSAETRTQLAGLMPNYAGKACLGLVDVARDQTLAQHLRVQGLPSIRVIKDGQIADQVDGPQPPAALQEMLDRLTLSSADMLKGDLDHYIQIGDYDSALKVLEGAIAEEPNNKAFRVELADVLICKGELTDAQSVLRDIPEDTEGRERPQTRLALVEEAQSFSPLAELQTRHESQPEDLNATYELAVALAAAADFEPALELAMEILRTDREFRDDIGRLTMIRIFSVLPKGSEIAQTYRRKMFAFMH